MQKKTGVCVKVSIGGRGQGGCEPRNKVIVKMQKKRIVGVGWGSGRRGGGGWSGWM